MFKFGVCSISFRKYSVDEIIEATKASGLDCIEWGSDVHVPPDNLEYAKEVCRKTHENSLYCSSYGSYYKLGVSEPNDIIPYIKTAQALGTNLIRIWGGTKGSNACTFEDLLLLNDAAQKVCKIALENNITIALECHRGTITDTYSSALDFIELVGAENLKLYWQPNQYNTEDYNLDSSKALSPYTTNIHVFNWDGDKHLPLELGKDAWVKYLDNFKENDHTLLLEFMHDNKLESLKSTAKTLFEIGGIVK